MSTLILAPTDIEFRAFESRLGGEPFPLPRGRAAGEAEVRLATAGGRSLFYARLGLGKLNAALMAAHVLERIDAVSCVIVAGVAGGLDPSLQPGDTVIGTSALHLDIGYQDHDGIVLAAPGEFPAKVRHGSEPLHLCDPAALMLLDEKTAGRRIAGRIGTTDRFIADAGFAAMAHTRFNLATIDMETAVIGHVAEQAGLKWAAVRTITDGADDDAMEDFMQRLERCAGIAADAAVSLAKSWLD